jgi:hypothetical protein
MVLLSLQFLHMDATILVDIRTRFKIHDKFNILYVVYLTNSQITVHCTRNQVELPVTPFPPLVYLANVRPLEHYSTTDEAQHLVFKAVFP